MFIGPPTSCRALLARQPAQDARAAAETAQCPGGAAVPDLARRPAADGDFRPPLSARRGKQALPWPVLSPACAYPATNDPGVWNGLHGLIRHSGLLTRQLRTLQQANWTIHWNLGRGTCCHPLQGRIDVDVALDQKAVVQNLAHESSHAFDQVVMVHQYAAEDAYLGALMRNEAVAVVSHLRVREEIGHNGGVDIGVLYTHPDYYVAALAFYRRHGNFERLVRHVAQMYVWQVNSVERVSYWQSYVNMFRRYRQLPQGAVSDQFIVARQAEARARLAWEMQTG